MKLPRIEARVATALAAQRRFPSIGPLEWPASGGLMGTA